MRIFYDLIISISIGGTILVSLLSFNGYIVQKAGDQTVKVTTQTNLSALTDILENRLRKMGYCVPGSPDSSIVLADSTKIKFKGDFDGDGTVDTVTYYLDPTLTTGNANGNTKILKCTLNNQAAQLINIGVTCFRIWYFDASGTPITAYPAPKPSLIKSFKVALNVESKVPFIVQRESYDKLNPGVYWEKVIKPKNLN
jgi:hypothetical protein